jgi:hypothetical protein
MCKDITEQKRKVACNYNPFTGGRFLVDIIVRYT